jgi:hypothetical protein
MSTNYEQPTLNFDHASDQTSRILNYLKAGNRITPIEALNLFGCFRLGSRIYDIKKLGHNIDREMVKLANGKRVARYRLLT